MAIAKIEAVIFDLGNVLLNYDAKRSAIKFSKLSGVPIVKLWRHFFISRTEKAYTRGEVSSREFYRHAKGALKFEVSFKDFSDCWNDIFVENPGMDQLLTQLQKKYPLYLISNTNKLHFDYIKKNFKILRHFKKTFPSHEVGLRKPDARIFRTVLKEIGYKPREAVFIDDAPQFVRGAKRVGLHALRFQTKNKLVKDLRKFDIQI